MVDSRFFEPIGPRTLSQILSAIASPQVTVSDQQALIEIDDAGELESGTPNQICLAASKSYAQKLEVTRAGVVIVSLELADRAPSGCVSISSNDPHMLFVDILNFMFPFANHHLATKPEISSLGEPVLEANVTLGMNAVIGSGAQIGENTIIGPNTVIGPNVTIGRNCVIGANATIECSLIGDEVVVGHGARIGAEGFGWLDHGKSNRRIPQLGRAILQSNSEVGANTTVDRGALGDTVIGEGSKIGAMVDIGHNSHIGRNCLIASMVGFAGGTILEDSVLMGPKAAATGNLTIGTGTVIMARASVTKSVPPGSLLAGFPAVDVKQHWRELAAVRRLAKGGKK